MIITLCCQLTRRSYWSTMQITLDKSISQTPKNGNSNIVLSAEEDWGCWVHDGVRTCVGGHAAGYLRTTFDAKGAHLVHPQVTDVDTLTGDLNSAALKVLLLVHVHLESKHERVCWWVRTQTQASHSKLTTPAEDGPPGRCTSAKLLPTVLLCTCNVCVCGFAVPCRTSSPSRTFYSEPSSSQSGKKPWICLQTWWLRRRRCNLNLFYAGTLVKITSEPLTCSKNGYILQIWSTPSPVPQKKQPRIVDLFCSYLGRWVGNRVITKQTDVMWGCTRPPATFICWRTGRGD